MKKMIAVLLCGLLLFAAGCVDTAQPDAATPQPETSAAPAPASPVTATVAVKGFEGDVTVTVSLLEGVISDIKVEGPNESEEFGQKAIAQLPELIVNANSAQVDGVSGATFTSTAIKTAVQAALFQLDPSHPSADPNAWAQVNGYVKAESYNLVTGIDAVTGASYKSEVAAQKENNLLTQEESKELALDYLRGFVLYYNIAEGCDIGAQRIFVQSNIDLFEYLNATGASYAYGDSITGKNGSIYTYSLPSSPIDIEDYKAAIQLGEDTTVTDEEFIAAIGAPEYSYREMYAIGTSYNNVPGLAQSEAVLDPESMLIFMGSNPGSEKSMELAANPVIKMYWVSSIPEENYVCGSDVKDNDYYHSYGVRIEGKAGAIKLSEVIDTQGNILMPSCVRGGIRYGISITGAEEWFSSKPDADMTATAQMLAETRYYADKWSSMSDADKTAATSEIRAYMANIYLGNINETNMLEADVKEIKDSGKAVDLNALKGIMGPMMNRSGEGYAIRLASTGALIKVDVDEYLTNTLWIISDCATEEQVALYEAGSNPIMAKWAGRFFDLFQKLEEGQTATQLRRQVYYPNDDSSLDR